ncbi:MAG: DUF2130 domain-containing protein [Candidatus Levybacteria bacterium]|nr:DUF2130 domain-containing protein [Candidatus Levybacteria bacterium]
MDKIKCPHCGREVELSEAIVHELSEQVREEERKTLKAQFQEEKAKEIAAREKKVREDIEAENKQKDKELQKEKQEKLELEKKFARQLEEKDKEKTRIKEDARKDADEKHRLEKLEWEKQKISMQKTVDELQRKGKQGSQQLQGDVLELDLEERLRDAFPYDEFKPVPTGIRGGDIIHEIRNKHGNIAGKILWEAKRQKAWNKAWLTKLKDDMRKIDASDCILVTDILPTNIRVYDRIDNVWVTSYEYAIKLVSVLRLGLLNVAIAKSSASHTDEQLKDLYRIITSDSFRNKFEARREIIQRMRQELESEQASTERRWKRQAATIDALSKNNREIYGELEAHIPSLKPLGNGEILELQSGDEEDNQTKF